MYATGNKKMLNMLILQILETYSDEEHSLTQQRIMDLLQQDYGMTCDRRSVSNNIKYLKELGYEICESRNKGYYLMIRDFDNSELRFMIDSVLCSKNMTNIQVHDLIEKLVAKGNKYFSPQGAHVNNISEISYKDNNELFLAIETINEAIARKRKISFCYKSYNLDFKLIPRREERYIVNPYQMITANGLYYLIANYDKYDDVSHYRLDKIADVEIIEKPVKSMKLVRGLEKGLDLLKHLAEHIYMYSGESVTAKIEVPQDMMNELVDWFGKDFRILEKSEDKMIIRVNCNEKALSFWCLQYGPFVEILSPESTRDLVREYVTAMYSKYK